MYIYIYTYQAHKSTAEHLESCCAWPVMIFSCFLHEAEPNGSIHQTIRLRIAKTSKTETELSIGKSWCDT